MSSSEIMNLEPFVSNECFNDWFETDFPIYHCYFDKNKFDDSLFNLAGMPFPEKLTRAVVKRKAEFLAGRYCASKVLSEFGLGSFHISVGEKRNPLWPEHIVGSISHCDTAAVAIASQANQYLGIGIDIEEEITVDTMSNIESKIVFGDEVAMISENAELKPRMFSIIFSLKESFFKAAYPIVQRYFDFDAISVTSLDQATGKFTFTIKEDLHKKLPIGMSVEGRFHVLPDDKVVTLVCLEHKD